MSEPRVASATMEPPREKPGPWVPGGVPAIVIGAIVAIVSFIALDLEPVAAFWALTAGLPLVAFVVIGIVWFARRLAATDDDQEVLP
jgi:hypothetical protein